VIPRIGVIGRQSPDDFADNICDSLTAMGIANVRLGWPQISKQYSGLDALLDVARRSVRVEEFLQRSLVRRASEHECTAILTVEEKTSPHAVRQLRENGLPVALWFPDAVANLGRLQCVLAPYTVMFFKGKGLADRLRATLGVPAHYLPEACNDRWHRSSQPQGVEPVIVVAGNLYSSRVRVVERLHDAGLPLVLYGGRPPRWLSSHSVRQLHTGTYLARQEKADVFRRAAAVLNNLHPGEVDGVNCRLFEAAGSGAVVLAERRAVMQELFAEDELLPWGTFDELVHQAKAAVDARGGCAAVGDRAARRAHRDHTYEQRLAVILQHF
jgi:spore maturation protein CgeB